MTNKSLAQPKPQYTPYGVSVNVTSAAPGDFVEYTFTFTNNTAIPMNDLVFSDILDPYLINPTLIGGSPSISSISMGANNTITTNSFAISSTVGFPPVPSTVTCTLQVQIDPNYSFINNVGANCLPTINNCVSLIDNLGNVIPCAQQGCIEVIVSNVGGGNNPPISAQALLTQNSAYFTNNFIPISGTLVIDVNVFATNCQFVMAPDAKIIVQTGFTLYVTNSQFYGCDYMWEGMQVENGAGLRMINCEMRDALTALRLEQSCFSTVQNSIFTDNFIGIYVPTLYPNGYIVPITYGSVGTMPFTGNTFQGTGTLKPFVANSSLQFPPSVPNVLGSLPFAGMCLIDVMMSIGSVAAPNYNLFYTMNCGIRAINCQLNVENTLFKNLHHQAPYTNVTNTGDGAGIWATKPQNWDLAFPTLRQRGFGNTPSAAYSFDECEEGIFATAVNVTSILNSMIRIRRTAHEIVLNVDGRGRVDSNRISSDWGGILINAITSNMNPNAPDFISASYNNINITGDFGGGEFGIVFAQAKGQFPPASTFPTASIHRDTVTLDKRSGWGIWLYDCKEVSVTENEVHIRNTPLNYYTMQQGIALSSGKGHIVSCNVIDGDVNNDQMKQRAFYVFQNTQSEISCNSTNGTGIGALFIDNCNPTKWMGNHLYDHYRGLSVGLSMANNPQMGVQDYRGNLWLGAYGDPTIMPYGGGACFMDPLQSNYVSSQFRIDPNGATTNHPEYFINGINVGGIYPQTIATGFDWFDNTISLPDFDCITANVCPNTQLRVAYMDSTYNREDSVVAYREYSPAYYTETAKIESAKKLYEKILTDSINTGIFYDFKDSLENETDIVSYLKIEKENQMSFENDNIHHVLDSLHNQIHIIDSLLISSNNPQDSLFQVQQKIGLQNEINSLLQNFSEANLPNIAAYQLKIDSLIVLNQTLSTSTIAEENENTVNHIYLNTITDGNYIFDSLQQVQLLLVASQCALAGGNSVYKARSMYALISDTTFNDEEICPSLGYNLRHGNNVSKGVADLFQIVPNPAQDYFEVFAYKAGVYEIQLWDYVGKLVSKQTFEPNDLRIRYNLYGISAGSYRCVILSAGNILYQQPLIILE